MQHVLCWPVLHCWPSHTKLCQERITTQNQQIHPNDPTIFTQSHGFYGRCKAGEPHWSTCTKFVGSQVATFQFKPCHLGPSKSLSTHVSRLGQRWDRNGIREHRWDTQILHKKTNWICTHLINFWFLRILATRSPSSKTAWCLLSKNFNPCWLPYNT